jgi:hypothetical protein
MSRQAARFQARSALSGTGFTTRESESVVDHPVRRRVVMLLMLLGNAGLVAAASSLILGFRGATATGDQWIRILELVGGLLVLVFASRSAWVDRRLTSAIGGVLRRFTDLPRRDLGGLLQLSGDYSVKELSVASGDWLADRTLADLGLRDEGVAVLGITRRDGRYVGAPTGATSLRPGDVLVVYGRDDSLAELDDRRAGPSGDHLHQLSVGRQAMAEAREQGADAPVPPRAESLDMHMSQ